MSTITTSLARLARLGRPVCVPLLVAGALAAGCGSVHATASKQPAPVPTVTGGAAAGQSGCVGWPADPTHVTMPQFFVPVAAERCVTGIKTITGKGQWQIATLEKATSDLTPLIAALRHPPVAHTPETFCPALAMLPPQIALISASGQELVPMLPVTGCGLVQSAVLTAIAALPWQPVSVRLIAPVASTPQGGATPSATRPPKTLQPLTNYPGVRPE